MPIPFEFVMEGPPVSQQARHRERVKAWIEEVRSVATQDWNDGPPVDEAVEVTITYFYDSAPLDVDNIPKPILDSLKGLVYSDDSQVFDLVCRKRDMTEELQIHNPSVVLLDRLRNDEPMLHIVVSRAMTKDIVL